MLDKSCGIYRESQYIDFLLLEEAAYWTNKCSCVCKQIVNMLQKFLDKTKKISLLLVIFTGACLIINTQYGLYINQYVVEYNNANGQITH